MDRKKRARTLMCNILSATPKKKKRIKRKVVQYKKFREELIDKGTKINPKYLEALDWDSSLLSDAIKNKDFVFIKHIIKYYTIKNPIFNNTNSNSKRCSEIFLTRFNEFKENINLFESNLFCRADVLRYLECKTSLLQLVIDLNDYHLAKKLINQGADVNEIPYHGQSLLHHAVFHQNKDIVKLLLENNADPNVKDNFGESVFFRAIRRNDFEIAECLIKAGAKVDEPSAEFSPLQWAISRRNHKMAEFIINSGDVNLVCCGKTPLHYAVDVENDDLINLLIKNKADINGTTCVKRAETALGTAIKKHNLDLIKTVVSLGADVNLFTRYVTPLQFAIIKHNYNSYGIVEFLIKSGAEVNRDSSPESKYFGQKPLHIATEKGIIQIMRLLIKKNADIDAVTKSGKTALGIAVECQNFESVDTLVSAGADVNLYSAGMSPLSLAMVTNNHKIVKYLIDHGADVNVEINIADESDNDIIGDESTENIKTTIKQLVKENIVRFRAADLNISEGNLLAVSGSEFNNLYAKCCAEVALMKTINAGKTTLTYYDMLHTSVHNMAMRFKYVDDCVIWNFSFERKFPLYAGILNHRLKKTIERKQLLDESSEIIADIFYRQLPYIFTRQMLWYLTNRDLTILTYKRPSTYYFTQNIDILDPFLVPGHV